VKYALNGTFADPFNINARNNWWGDPYGPYHAIDNPSGKGDNVTGDVTFEPWLNNIANRSIGAYILSIDPNPVKVGEGIEFQGYGIGENLIVKYQWWSSFDEDFSNNERIFEISNLLQGTHTIFFQVQDQYGIWSDISNATLIVYGKPSVSIESISPSPAHEGERITFQLNNSMNDDIDLIVWESSIDGVIYQGSEDMISISNLSVGSHVISVKIRNKYGLWSNEVNRNVIVEESDEGFFSDQIIILSVIIIILVCLLVWKERERLFALKK